LSDFYLPGLDRDQTTNARFSPNYLSERPITAISSDIFSR